MKIFSYLLLLFFCISFIPSFAQQQDTINVKSIEEAINSGLKNFRYSLNDKRAIVYCIIKYRLDHDIIAFNDQNLLVENSLNARYIHRNRSNYLLYFIISQKKCETIVDVSTASIHKKSKKKISLSFQESVVPILRIPCPNYP